VYDSREDTLEHIRQVALRIGNVCQELHSRGLAHDASKLGPEEKPTLDAVLPLLKAIPYGTAEYRDAVKQLGAARDHHFANNSHHPEFYANGVSGMNIIDLIEMYCDWAAATASRVNGNLQESIDLNGRHFGMGDVLTGIFRNTYDRYGGFSAPLADGARDA
jgi:hypothetical protein